MTEPNDFGFMSQLFVHARKSSLISFIQIIVYVIFHSNRIKNRFGYLLEVVFPLVYLMQLP